MFPTRRDVQTLDTLVRIHLLACSVHRSVSVFHATKQHSSLWFINVKNFHGSLTTVVRAQNVNDTSKTANITDTIYDRTYWYPLNWSRDCHQKFIIDIQATAFWKSVRSDVLYLANYRCSVCNGECKPPPTPKLETKVIRDSYSD